MDVGRCGTPSVSGRRSAERDDPTVLLGAGFTANPILNGSPNRGLWDAPIPPLSAVIALTPRSQGRAIHEHLVSCPGNSFTYSFDFG